MNRAFGSLPYRTDPLPSRSSSCQAHHFTATIDIVPDNNDGGVASHPFQPGTMVVLTLGNPREKFWGAVLSLAPEGVCIRGIELASFDDLVSLVKDNEPYSPGVVFSSLSQRFTARTGLDPSSVLAPSGERR